MRKSLYIFLLFGLTMLLNACTHNDGNIGAQFGQWQLIGAERDGVSIHDWEGEIYWSFQNSTIEMKRVSPDHTAVQTFGNYRIEDETLYLDFPDEARPPLPEFHMPRQAEMQIVRLRGGEMILAYGAPATLYTFRKW